MASVATKGDFSVTASVATKGDFSVTASVATKGDKSISLSESSLLLEDIRVGVSCNACVLDFVVSVTSGMS